ncbi:MAG: hypothetical protein IMF26_05095 [Candidatus Fermentithermobacillus carboniphilus]|uniref:CN hydrolase domain-containing protein n=1 Tax=Candidatus Fermentithermobacillus carboniphilus TaxID=3085328 RepID=A0AAT9LFR8_9FIRM|nr:MAG: hypothetical protein IMF26_05095 [Candidatus Fermentithermobacillus carboniphilus]
MQLKQTRVIWLVLVVIVLLPLIKPLGLPLGPSPETEAAYQFIDKLPSRSITIMDLSIAPSSEGELWPMALAIGRHHMAKGHRVIVTTFIPDGVMYAEKLKEVAEKEFGYKYGVDILVLPYRAGGETALVALADNIRQAYDRDQYGRSLSELPMWQDITKIEDIALVSCYTAGDDHLWLARHVWAKHKVPCLGGVIALSAPEAIVYFQNGQLVGLISGVKGAAYYESKIGKPGLAVQSMDAQSLGHAYLLFLMIAGNIVFWTSKRRNLEKRPAGGD